ncbi:MAG: queuosine precursor transporter [Paracoccaceae bacterium]
MTRSLVAGIAAMAVIVVASNVLVQFLCGPYLTWGAFTYPFAFLVTDLVNRFHGPRAARRVVVAGFAVGVICSLIGSRIAGEFGPLVSFRVALGSGAAFLAAQLLDIAVFNRLRRQAWWRAPFISTLAGSTLDTLVFFSIAFSAAFVFLDPAADMAWAQERLPVLGYGPVAPLWVSLACADWLVKMAIDLFALVPFRLFVWRFAARVA